jgi:hypothetical protein
LRSTEAEKAQDEHDNDDEPYEVNQLVHDILDALNVGSVANATHSLPETIEPSRQIATTKYIWQATLNYFDRHQVIGGHPRGRPLPRLHYGYMAIKTVQNCSHRSGGEARLLCRRAFLSGAAVGER